MDDNEQSTPEELAAEQRRADFAIGMMRARERMRLGRPADTSYPSEWKPPPPRHRNPEGTR